MRGPLISVVMPVRDAANTVGAALESLRTQTFTDFEILALDHGSTDDTPRLLREWSLEFDAMKVFEMPREIPFADVLNFGISKANGAWIARMDADDLNQPDRFARQIAFARDNPDLDVIACRVAFGGDPVARAGYARHVNWINSLISHEEMALGRFRESPIAHPSVLVRKEAFGRFGAYRAGPFPEDYELWLRWFERGARFGKCPEILLTWNDPANRLSRTDLRYSFDAFYEIKAEYLALWLARHNPFHPDVIIIGAGRITRRRVERLMKRGIRVIAWADLDPRKVGRRYHGAQVIPHEEMPPPGHAFLIPYVSAIGAPDYIRAMLLARGYRLGLDFIEAA